MTTRRSALRVSLSLLVVMGLGCASTSPPDAAPSPASEPQEKRATFPRASAWSCPEGPFPTPISGERHATEILDTDPMDAHLYEGPVWIEGALYFSDFRFTDGFPSRIMRYTPGTGLEVALPDSGSNGLALDPRGALVAASHDAKGIVRLSDGEEDVARKFEGRPFNSPNDLVFRNDGNLYFTDPNFQSGGNDPQPTTNVYRVTPEGETLLVDASIRNPNGIALSPDGATLYVAGNLEQGYLKRYPVAPDGSVGSGDILLEGLNVPDGLAVDCAGNIYVTEHTEQRIRVITRDGAELGRIMLDANVTNAAFGGESRRTLFITSAKGLFSIELSVPGYPY